MFEMLTVEQAWLINYNFSGFDPYRVLIRDCKCKLCLEYNEIWFEDMETRPMTLFFSFFPLKKKN